MAMTAEAKPLYQLTITLSDTAQQELATYYLDELGHSSTQLEEGEGKCYVHLYDENIQVLNKIKSTLQQKFTSIEISKHQGPDWREEWKKHLKPIQLAGDVWVTPPWSLPPRGEHPENIVIQPQMAFGTGHHESTRLMAQAMFRIKNQLKGSHFLDVGAGSGIIQHLAHLWGSKSSWGLENDLECFDNLNENHVLNNKPPLRFIMGELACLKVREMFDVCTINMIRTRSLPLINPLSAYLKKGGTLIWSGIETKDSKRVIREIPAHLKLEKEFTENGWWCGLIRVVHEDIF